MSFSFAITGTKKGVLRELENVTGHGDTSQLDAAKAFVKSEVEALPDDYKHFIEVGASGHHDATNRNVKIEIKPQYTKLALDEPENGD